MFIQLLDFFSQICVGIFDIDLVKSLYVYALYLQEMLISDIVFHIICNPMMNTSRGEIAKLSYLLLYSIALRALLFSSLLQ